MVGVKFEDITNSIANVKSSYQTLMTSLHDDVQNQFVNEMQQVWACKQAQLAFDAFKQSYDAELLAVNKTYENIVEVMNSAAVQWAQALGQEFTPQNISLSESTINVSGVRENINGLSGIDLSAANTIVSKLVTINDAALAALDKTAAAVNVSGFEGNNQGENLFNSVTEIKNKIAKLNTDITNDMKSYMNQTVESYGDLAGAVARAFNGQ